MKMLIIGSKGFIGSHCVDYFKSQGHQIWEVDINESQEENCYVIDGHNSDFSLPFQEHQFDVCINASGSAHVGFSFENPSKDFELNVINVQKILVAIRDYNNNCKFINFSSAAVYGNPQTLPIAEDSVCKPLSPYGFHKLQSELLLTEYHKFFGLYTCNLRVFSAYGPRLKKQLFWDLSQKSLQSNVISLFGTGNETRDFIYINDLVQIINLVIQHSTFQGTIYNVGSNVETTIFEAAQVFFNAFSPNKEVVFNGEVKVGDPNNWLADMEILKKYGFEPQFNLHLGLKKYAEWLKENE
ncbi:dTDP-glucose 4,6-dehydratase/UDP-glucose 4-epimerase [Flavobacterium fryxellicola]|uniref:dTDP-glucose 4,6-dehydratase n=1 Tax=Flavobacterium fryxellicola TaxID=249352 RepID=A0A167WZB0_9FLAO|nr:SDR family oxidoreductase [Flavobacterium fryxellicola]OAB27878.1 dTDP-glucose 4,6-dehydratase [Flavobacterium fryxellicola]SHN66033.1 dTDP-glucose 4,6-dehydratase/UDP-glucose 4-epimerase [Flavobacterium fryxellicola]